MAPYYHFPLDYPSLFYNMQQAAAQIGVLHLWESLLYSDWTSPSYFSLCNLLDRLSAYWSLGPWGGCADLSASEVVYEIRLVAAGQ